MTTQKKPKVVIATRLFAPEVGAAAFRLKALADGLASAGADVHVVTTIPPKGSTPLPAQYRTSRWPVLRDPGGNVRGYIQYLSFDIPAFLRLLLCRADVVVSEPPPTTGLAVALSSWIRRRPYVYYAADVWTEALAATQVPSVVVSAMRAVEGFVLKRAAKVIAVSEPVAAQVRRFGIPAARICVVGNGIDTTVFGPSGNTAGETVPYFVYTGTMSEWQGAEVFIRALEVVREHRPEVKLRFFGQGTDEPHLRQLAGLIAPEHVHFGGVVPPERAAEWIRGASAALVSIKPGAGYDFAKPTKIYAAASCGTPVIFAGEGDGAAVVADNALGVAPGYDHRSVAEAMLGYLENGDGGGEARTRWVAGNASLAASGRLAAKEVIGQITGNR